MFVLHSHSNAQQLATVSVETLQLGHDQSYRQLRATSSVALLIEGSFDAVQVLQHYEKWIPAELKA